MSQKISKIVVIVGPTASGKTGLALRLAKELKGEIVSADSRQIYQGMDVGSGKPKGLWQKVGDRKIFVVEGIPHYLMDSVKPDAPMSVAEFKTQAIECLNDIVSRGKTPFLAGGTGLYISAVLDNLTIPPVLPDATLRTNLEKKSVAELAEMLQTIDLETVAKIDMHNPRRLIRALEVAITSGQSFLQTQKRGPQLFESLMIGLNWPREELYKRINARVDEQMEEGLVAETKNLLARGYDFTLPSMSGIGYREIAAYLEGELTLREATEKIKQAVRQYSRRQRTWFKRDKRIRWIDGDDYEQAKGFIENFLH